MPKIKIPKPPKPKRPKVKDLRMVLKGLMTVSVQNRIRSLATHYSGTMEHWTT